MKTAGPKEKREEITVIPPTMFPTSPTKAPILVVVVTIYDVFVLFSKLA